VDPEQWRRVNAAFQNALAQPSAERAAFLERVSLSPEDRREVQALLRLHEEDSGFLESGLGALAADLLAPEPAEIREGYRIGSYTVVRELGRGGMGIVYLGRDVRLDRPVAIKMLTPNLAHDAVGRERLKREARAAAAVSHPGIAHVYALEEDSRGVQYIVSEYVEGHTLRAEIEKGPLPPALVVETALAIARALAVAHARHIIHRDLKPENVMRTLDGRVKVLDFGLARSDASASVETAMRLTASGMAMGTPGYMSPEQWRGETAGPATDIFSLGLVIYEMAAGTHAFAAGARTPAIARVLDGRPSPVPAGVDAALPGLAAVLDRCLQPDPEARYPSRQALIADLEALAGPAGPGGLPVTPRQLTPPYAIRSDAVSQARTTWWWQFHQAAVSAVLVATIYPVWLVRHPNGLTHGALVLAIVVLAALSATLRLHLVFTARVSPGSLAAARGRVARWIRGLDWLTAALLLGAAAVAFAGDQLWLAALLATVAACSTAAFLIIEPATADAAFPESSTEVRIP
jgi:serine/threonine protein kinase